MKLNNLKVTAFEISDVKALDPIRVYLENYEAGKGRITITCFASAWVGYWGAMSGDTIEKFFMRCDADYLMSNLQANNSLIKNKANDLYLMRIIQAIQNALREIVATPLTTE